MQNGQTERNPVTSRPWHGLVSATLQCAALLLALASPTRAAEPVPVQAYDDPQTWLCRPGRQDLCALPTAFTTYEANGKLTASTRAPDPSPPIDCFYVYPTISMAPQGNSPRLAGPGELRAAQIQVAPFNAACRVFAPLYRQVTLAGLRSAMGAGDKLAIDPGMGIEDVRAAWKHYLAHDNQGRGVLLIGHSQGSRMLQELLAKDVEGTPVQQRLVAAYLIGFNQFVPKGGDVGDSFKSLPLCKSATQTGCVVAYSTFRDSAPPPGNARFGRSDKDTREVACVDVPALTQTDPGAMLPVPTDLLGRPWEQGEWRKLLEGVKTPFIGLPGYVKVGCVRDGLSSYLAVSLNPAKDARLPDLPLDLKTPAGVLWDWGLHLVDMDLVQGSLIELALRQGAAFGRRN